MPELFQDGDVIFDLIIPIQSNLYKNADGNDGIIYCPNCRSGNIGRDSKYNDSTFFMTNDTLDTVIPMYCNECNYSFSLNVYFEKE
jgi:hypothetical protein